jgi:type VI secretion system protein ImpL
MRELLRYLPVPPRWAATLLGALALGTLIWYLGPTLGFGTFRPLASSTTRLVAVGVVVLLWLAATLVTHLRQAAADKKLVAGTAGGEAKGAAPAGAEVAALRQHLEEAQRYLKRLHGPDRRGKKYLYELPWYILIGPPGAGKTTALTNCGLKFPLAERHGNRPVKGAAGTRNCDWFLTDEAVLLDTAGRYTTQDSDEKADQTAWLGFLDLLKEYRPRQPINGVLVAISQSDLMTLPEEQRMAHARAIRARLAELLDRFSVRFPVYVLFTKSDLIAGFVESWDSLTREEREQVWGMTFPLDPGGEADAAVEQFDEEFRLLLARLDERMLDRVQQEVDIRRRGLIFGLPTQLASQLEMMSEFLGEVFLASRFETRPLLRGVYFTSGTQEGTPIDRLMGAIAQRFGLERQRLIAFTGTGRSYFLTRLLREVVFAEASIVSADPRVERRHRLIRWGTYSAVALVFLLACGAWTVSYLENKRLETQVQAASNAVLGETARLDTPVLHDDDLSQVLAALDGLRGLPGGFQTTSASVPLSMTFGLYQGGRLHSEEIAAYQRGLNLLLLPRLLSRLQKQLAANLEKPEFLYDGLRIYLMLGGRHPVDPGLVKDWMSLDWENALPGADNAAKRAALQNHLDALLSAQLDEYPLDAAVVAEARRRLLQVPVASRAYLMLKERPAASSTPDWHIIDYAGPGADRVLVRPSGKLLSDGVPALYTRAGFYHDVLPRLPGLVESVEHDSWVLADQAGTTRPVGGDDLTRDILALYYNDYTEQWESLIADIAVRPVRTLTQAADMLNFASGPNSPLKLVWQAIASETRLSQSPDPPPAAPASSPPKSNDAGAPIATVLARPAARPNYGQPVEERFAQFYNFVAAIGGGPATVELFLQDLATLYRTTSRLAAATPGGSDAAGLVADANEAVHKIEEWAPRLPTPTGDVAKSVARNIGAVVKGEARSDIGREWQSKVLPFCTQALDGRYPLRRSSSVDVTPDDFARLFAPNGLIDAFFKASLQPYVDTSQNPWKPQSSDLGSVSLSAAALEQFQRASRIRDMFFAGGTTPALHFEVTPRFVDPGAGRAVLNIEGQEIAFDGTSGRPVVVQWPGPAGVHQSSIVFEPNPLPPTPLAAAASKDAAPAPAPVQPLATIARTGAWSWLRLLDAGRLERLGGPDRWRVTFAADGLTAVYEIHTGSVVNPLASHDLADFKCPATL